MSSGKEKEEGKIRQIPPRSLTVLVIAAGIALVLFTARDGAKFGKQQSLGLDPDWVEALAWVKNNTNQSEIVASWWDYGYWIETFASRITLADGATIKDIQIRDMAKAFLGTEKDMNDLCERYNVSLIMLSVAEDVVGGKWGAMAYIAKLNANEYVVENKANKTIALLPKGQNAPIFRMASLVLMDSTLLMDKILPVHRSPNGRVVVYCYVPYWGEKWGHNVTSALNMMGFSWGPA